MNIMYPLNVFNKVTYFFSHKDHSFFGYIIITLERERDYECGEGKARRRRRES